MRRVSTRTVAFAALLIPAGAVFAGQADSVQPAELRTYSTLHSIGVEWEVSGDANHNARCEVRYRKADTEPWRRALDLFRIDYHGWYGDTRADRAYNMLAGSILFLEPGTAYEVQLALSDPDGGSETRTTVIKTRPEPVQPQGRRLLEVVPGAGGGDGSPGNPFQGLASAQSAAGPGDLLRVHSGHYGEFTFDKSGTPEERMAWVAAGDGEVVLSKATVTASHLWLEGLVFRRGPDSSNGLVAKGSPQDVVVSHNQFHGFHYSVLLSNQSRDWYIADNTIVGDKENPGVSDISGEGIEQHALHVHKEETFEIQDIPAYASDRFSARRLTLKPGCAAIDAGQAMPNASDDFEGKAPDLGAYELGRAVPHFGPRENAKTGR